jgi:hypothetical protein
MKRLVLSLAILLPVAHSAHAMELPKKKHECSVKCVKVCTEVNHNHKNVMLDLAERLQTRQNLGNACGNASTHIKSEGLEFLFAEPEIGTPHIMPKPPVTIAKSCPQAIKTTQYCDIDAILQELEKDLPKLPTAKKITLIDYSKEITALIRRAGSQTLALLKEGSSDAEKNNLDATCNQLAEKNNIFPDVIGAATDAEKNDPEFIRFSGFVTLAAESAQRLGSTKKPLIQSAEDINHPFNSYTNELRLLQRLLTQKK